MLCCRSGYSGLNQLVFGSQQLWGAGLSVALGTVLARVAAALRVFPEATSRCLLRDHLPAIKHQLFICSPLYIDRERSCPGAKPPCLPRVSHPHQSTVAGTQEFDRPWLHSQGCLWSHPYRSHPWHILIQLLQVLPGLRTMYISIWYFYWYPQKVLVICINNCLELHCSWKIQLFGFFHSREMRKDHALAMELDKVKLGSLLPSSLSKELEKKYLDSEEVRKVQSLLFFPSLLPHDFSEKLWLVLHTHFFTSEPHTLHTLPGRSKSFCLALGNRSPFC